MKRSFMARAWALTLLSVACTDDTEIDAANLVRPSGMAVRPVFEPDSGSLDGVQARYDVLIADSEADGVRVLQFRGAPNNSEAQESSFLDAPIVFDQLLIPAPGFPTEVRIAERASVFTGTETSTGTSSRAFALAPGQGLLHALWVPPLRFNATSDQIEGHRRVGTVLLNRALGEVEDLEDGALLPDQAPLTLPSVSLLELDATLRDYTPVSMQVLTERDVEAYCGAPGDASPRARPAVQSRVAVAFAANQPGAPGRLLVLDVFTALTNACPSFPSADILRARERGLLGVSVQGEAPLPAAPRRMVAFENPRTEEADLVVTSAFAETVDPATNPPVQTSSIAVVTVHRTVAPVAPAVRLLSTPGPTLAAMSLTPATSPDCSDESEDPTTAVGFAVFRSNAPQMITFDCGAGDCVQSARVIDSPFEDPDAIESEPGILALRPEPVASAAFGLGRFRVADADGTEFDPADGCSTGAALLVHQDGQTSLLAGPPLELGYINRRTGGGEMDAPVQAIFTRTRPDPTGRVGLLEGDGGARGAGRFRVENCANEGGTPEAPLACAENATGDSGQGPRRAETCTGIRVTPRVEEEATFAATFQGPLIRSLEGEGIEGFRSAARCSADGRELEFDLGFPAIGAPLDFVERRVQPGDRAALFARCDDVGGDFVQFALGRATDGRVVDVSPLAVTMAFTAGDLCVGGAPAFEARCEPGTFEIAMLEVYPSGPEFVLTRQDRRERILDVVQRVPAGVSSTGQTTTANASFSAELTFDIGLEVEGVSSSTLECAVNTGMSPENPGFTCTTPGDCGPGRSCIRQEGSNTCFGACEVACGSASRCIVELEQRACPELQIQVLGDNPVVPNLNAAGQSRRGAPFPGAFPDSTVYIPVRRSFITSFPGARQLREVLAGEETTLIRSFR